MTGFVGGTGPSGYIGVTGVTAMTGIIGSTGLSGATGQFNTNDGATLFVDSVFGNDSTAQRQRFDLPYLTVGAAAAAAQTGDVVMLRPGSFPITAVSGLVISPGVSVLGSGQRFTTLTHNAITGGGTMITMADNTSVRDVTLNMLSTVNALNLVGIQFTGTSVSSAFVRNVSLSLSNTGTSSPSGQTIYGISLNSTATGPFNLVNVMDCRVNVVGQGTTTSRALINLNGSSHIVGGYFTANPLDGQTSLYGAVQCVAGLLSLEGISAQGTAFDISQAGGTLLIDRVSYLSSGSTLNQIFSTVNSGSSTQVVTSGFFGSTSGTGALLWNGIMPSFTAGATSSSVELVIQRITIFKNLTVRLSAAPATSALFSLSRNGISVLSANIISPATSATSIGSRTFAVGDHANFVLVLNGGGTNDAMVTVEAY
jgi:hypothetical protein